MAKSINWRSSLSWAYLVLGFIALWATIQSITSSDFWWHMKIGEVVLASGSIPTTGVFSGTRGNASYVYQSWGSEVLFALIGSVSLALLHTVRTGLIVLTYWLVLKHAWQRSNNGRAVAIGLFLAMSVGLTNWAIRPQMFSLPLFALISIILTNVSLERWSRRTLIAVPLLTALWVNLHGAFILAPLLTGAVALGGTIDRRRDHDDAPTYPTMRAVWITCAASCAALLLNPRGIGVITYVWTLLTDPGSQTLGSEWSSPLTRLGAPTTQFFLLTLVVGGILIAAVWRKLRTADLIVALAFAFLALTGIRYLIWFGIVSGPIIAEALVRRGRLSIIKKPSEPTPILGFLAAAIVALAVALQPLWAGFIPRLGSTSQSVPNLPDRLVASDTPLVAVEHLLKNPPQGAIFNDEGDGSYIIWRAGEALPVFVDTRIELYPLDQWNEFRCIGKAQDWERLVAKYNINTIIAKRTDQIELISALQNHPAWERTFDEDPAAVVYERRGTATPAPNQSCEFLKGNP